MGFIFSAGVCLSHLHYMSSFSEGEGLLSVSQDSVFRGMLTFPWQDARSLQLSLEIPQTGNLFYLFSKCWLQGGENKAQNNWTISCKSSENESAKK